MQHDAPALDPTAPGRPARPCHGGLVATRPGLAPALGLALAPALALAFALGGCTRFPELDREISDEARTAPAPELAEIGGLLSAPPPSRAEGVEEGVTARSEALQARGAALGATGADAERDALIEARRRRLVEERARLSE